MIAAALLLLAIGTDLSQGSRCHPLPHAQARDARISGLAQPPSGDACATGCVPDCYGCSTISMTAVYVPQEVVGTATPVPAPADRRRPPGLHPLPYHPPLALS